MQNLNLKSAYRTMLTIRTLEESVLCLARDGVIPGSIHPCLGQEAVAAGAVSALESSDRLITTYRGHGWALAKGADLHELLAEIAMKATGLNGGRAGSALLSDPEHGFFGENSIVGAGGPIAAGVGLAAKLSGSGRVCMVVVGDGALNQGALHEAMCFTAMHQLPVIFLVENNGWAEMTPTTATSKNISLVERATGVGILGESVDGQDVLAVHAAVATAAAHCRGGDGPYFLECRTVRMGGHYNRDIEHYRSASDREAARDADPLPRLRAQLLDSGNAAEADIRRIEREVTALVDELVAAVRLDPDPDPLSATAHLYEDPSPSSAADSADSAGETRQMTMQMAINSALRAELEMRPEVLVYGEDVGAAGGIFGVTRRLQRDFGLERVFDTPISEAAIIGSAVGASMEGMRPVVEVMWGDFLLVALDQLVNQAANVRYINSGKLTAPLTVRLQQGATPGSCAQHSQSLEAILAHIPGIKVGVVASPQDAYSMTRAAIADNDPCVVVEARELYQIEGPVNLETRDADTSGARVHGAGNDVLIVTWGPMLLKAQAAAVTLADGGINARIVDLRWLRPLDKDALKREANAVGGRVVIAHDAMKSGGFGGEVATTIHELLEGSSPHVVRVAGRDSRIPAAPVLQEAVLPRTDDIVAACEEVCAQVETTMVNRA